MSNMEEIEKIEELLVKDSEGDKMTIETFEKTNSSLGKRIFSSLLDQAILIGVSGILLVLFDLFIGLFGYHVILPTDVLIIIYFLVNVLYYPLIERKNKKSIGKRILSIK